MTKTSAIKTARNESSMHQIGGQWVINTYDTTIDAWRDSQPMPYHQARNALSAWRVWRATQLLTGDTDAAYAAEYAYQQVGGTWQSAVA